MSDTGKKNGDVTPKKTPRPHLMPPWQPGQSGNPAGRPKGSRAKLAEDFCQALLDDFAKGGAAAIMAMRDERPGEYIRAIASVIPKEFEGNVTGDLSDDLKSWLGLKS
jgi:Family of unknown function (DUF5681)